MNRGFEENEEYGSPQNAQIERLLDAALAVEEPQGLVDRIFDATTVSLTAQFEGKLDAALAPDEAPRGMADRIVAATRETLTAQFDAKLDRALEPEALPAGGEQRIVNRMADEVRPSRAHEGVLARIGQSLGNRWKYAAAAAIVVIYGVGLWLSLGPQPNEPTDRVAQEPPVDYTAVRTRVDTVMDSVAKASEPYSDRDREIERISLEVDRMLAEYEDLGLFQDVEYDVNDDKPIRPSAQWF